MQGVPPPHIFTIGRYDGGGYVAAVAALALGVPLRAQDRLDGLLAQYQHEADPIRKARVLAKLGDDQVAQARDQLNRSGCTCAMSRSPMA